MTPSRREIGLRRYLATALAALALGGCSNLVDRLAAVGETPELRPIENPTLQPGYQPVSLPMPAPDERNYHANSLWRAGARGFFKDQRAEKVGDILTILIAIDDDAAVANSTTRTRDNNEDASVSTLFGYEQSFGDVLPDAINPTNLVDIDSDSRSQGTGKIDREEKINLRVAAVVSQVLPNGNMVINGSQEVRVNYEVRELYVQGVVRREDISSSNTVSHDQIAEARIAYGGRGQITDVQQPRYAQQIFDIIWPF
jgi:flagellar L-ring protein precursor FlgH